MGIRRVLIVGGGIGGLGLAAALGQQGIEVEIAEQRSEYKLLGVGINQPANSLRILRKLGLLDQVRSVGFAYDRNEFFDWQGNHIVTCPSNLGGDDLPANTALTRLNLHEFLLGAAQRAGARFHMGTTVEEFEDAGDHVDVVLSNGRAESYDLVVGFDGVHSDMRRRIFGDAFEPVYTGCAVWRLSLPRPAEVTHTMLFQGDRTKAGVIPLSESQMYLLVVSPEPGAPRHDPALFGDLLRNRLAGYGGLIGRIRDTITGPEGIVYSPINEVNLPDPWFKGRTIILGDAAHASAPHLTQGAGMALEDAWVLAEEITKDRPLEDSLAAVMLRRFQRTKLVQDVSREVLKAETTLTVEDLPHAVGHMRTALPAHFFEIEARLNQPA